MVDNIEWIARVPKDVKVYIKGNNVDRLDR